MKWTEEPYKLSGITNEKVMLSIIPHIPYYKAVGTHSHHYFWEDFTDRMGNKACIQKVKYLKMGTQTYEAVVRVVWED